MTRMRNRIKNGIKCDVMDLSLFYYEVIKLLRSKIKWPTGMVSGRLYSAKILQLERLLASYLFLIHTEGFL